MVAFLADCIGNRCVVEEHDNDGLEVWNREGQNKILGLLIFEFWTCWICSHNLNWAGMEEKGGGAQPKPDLESDPISILNFYLFYQINFYLKLIFYKIFKSFFLLVVRKFMIILFYFNFLNKNVIKMIKILK